LEAIGGLEAPAARGKGLGAKLLALDDFCYFSIKIMLYFGQNSYFKAITHQLTAFKKQFKRAKYE